MDNQNDVIRKAIQDFCLEFYEHPYLCYTEHGQHALFYSMLYNALPPEQRYAEWQGKRICVIQKEYPTAGNLGKPQRQHWDISVIKTPLECLAGTSRYSYDCLKLAAAIEFGLNECLEHLLDDVNRISHADANVEHGFIVHLYRLSKAGAKFSSRDWSPLAKRIASVEDIAQLTIDKKVEIYYGMADSTGKHTSGVWLIKQGEMTQINPGM
jgi:hypothetical protein